jgi:hypothetical protein
MERRPASCARIQHHASLTSPSESLQLSVSVYVIRSMRSIPYQDVPSLSVSPTFIPMYPHGSKYLQHALDLLRLISHLPSLIEFVKYYTHCPHEILTCHQITPTPDPEHINEPMSHPSCRSLSPPLQASATLCPHRPLTASNS